jgi:hypothetical protein
MKKTCLVLLSLIHFNLIGQTTREPGAMPSLSPQAFNYLDTLDLQALIRQNYLPNDSIVYQVLVRNAPHWQKILVVADWTGSMYPYGMQVLVWLNQQINQKDKIKKIIFFNDGDNKKLGEKVIGATGGFYVADNQDFKQIINTMRQAQMGGQGGDGSENDLEALLFGQQICKDCEDIVLLADAESMVRDLLLLPHLVKKIIAQNQKLHIVLCGKMNSAIADYLQIAQAVNGSLHTIQEDVADLQALSSAEIIKLYRRLLPAKKINGLKKAIK